MPLRDYRIRQGKFSVIPSRNWEGVKAGWANSFLKFFSVLFGTILFLGVFKFHSVHMSKDRGFSTPEPETRNLLFMFVEANVLTCDQLFFFFLHSPFPLRGRVVGVGGGGLSGNRHQVSVIYVRGYSSDTPRIGGSTIVFIPQTDFNLC